MTERKRVFITGAAGTIGTALRRHIRAWYDLRLLFHSRIPDDVGPSDEVVIGDIADYAAMVEATEGVDAIVHLALAHRPRRTTQAERAWQAFDVDMKGTYCVFEGARINRVPTLVYASTNHVTGVNEQEGVISRPELAIRPDSIYGVGKAFGEALGRLYMESHGLRVFCLRIANCNGQDDDPGRYYEPGRARWLSAGDLAQLVHRCIEAEGLNWGIFYGVSGGAEEKWDLTNARELLGYAPRDDGSAARYRERYRR